jgi:hypothetical protein
MAQPRFQVTASIVLSAIILIFGLWLIIPNHTAKNATAPATTQSSVISYKGVEGKNALELLQAGHQVEFKHYDFGDQVIAIDGVIPDPTHFWAFYVNDKLADVGAGAYITKSGDQITWKLDAIE